MPEASGRGAVRVPCGVTQHAHVVRLSWAAPRMISFGKTALNATAQAAAG